MPLYNVSLFGTPLYLVWIDFVDVELVEDSLVFVGECVYGLAIGVEERSMRFA